MQRKTEVSLIPKARLKFKPLTIRMPSDLMERIQRVKDDASALGYVFDAQTTLINAMTQALNRAEAELEKLLDGRPPSAKTG